MITAEIPFHLRKYIVTQDEQQYSAVDHAVWRYILRQLREYLSKHAHESYLSGLEKTGIEVERIPLISEISRKISNFGWRALPVSGFIPPAAFMELQALSILPIASDIRSLEHLLYTPAPDIVHEAAGHAPMLAHQEFSDYLRKYAQVARRSIISSEDLDIYRCIRVLSDVKENPHSTPEEIQNAENELKRAVESTTHVSEATWLSRMNWWTAEYGLIGTLENPRIYGAGLLSSVGEAKWCLSDNVKKIPFSIDCIEYSYDITEPQPQLFVTPDFQTLIDALDELADKMAFRIGGTPAVERAIQAKTVNTVELSSGLQISGVCTECVKDSAGEVAYLIFKGRSQLSLNEAQIAGHGSDYHAQGFGTPVGRLATHPEVCPSRLTDSQWKELGATAGGDVRLRFASGVEVSGKFSSRTKVKDRTVLISLTGATAKLGDRVLFDPSWGTFDMALGQSVVSVFGGPADRQSYGEIDDFVAARVAQREPTEDERTRGHHFAKVRALREGGFTETLEAELSQLFDDHMARHSDDWLFFMEIYELAVQHRLSAITDRALQTLKELAANEKRKAVIEDGLRLASTTSV